MWLVIFECCFIARIRYCILLLAETTSKIHFVSYLVMTLVCFYCWLQTGNSKGYAFVEFASKYTAKTVADCMNNYLMFHRLLKCKDLSSFNKASCDLSHLLVTSASRCSWRRTELCCVFDT